MLFKCINVSLKQAKIEQSFCIHVCNLIDVEVNLNRKKNDNQIPNSIKLPAKLVLSGDLQIISLRVLYFFALFLLCKWKSTINSILQEKSMIVFFMLIYWNGLDRKCTYVLHKYVILFVSNPTHDQSSSFVKATLTRPRNIVLKVSIFGMVWLKSLKCYLGRGTSMYYVSMFLGFLTPPPSPPCHLT